MTGKKGMAGNDRWRVPETLTEDRERLDRRSDVSGIGEEATSSASNGTILKSHPSVYANTHWPNLRSAAAERYPMQRIRFSRNSTIFMLPEVLLAETLWPTTVRLCKPDFQRREFDLLFVIRLHEDSVMLSEPELDCRLSVQSFFEQSYIGKLSRKNYVSAESILDWCVIFTYTSCQSQNKSRAGQSVVEREPASSVMPDTPDTSEMWFNAG